MKEHNIKLIALDLDGTLTNREKKVTKRNREAVWKAMEAGASVVLASGRPTIGITQLAKELELSVRGGFIQAYNGGEIIDCKKGTVIYKKTIRKALIPDICGLARGLDLHLLTYDRNGVITEMPEGEYVQKEAFCCGTTIRGVENLEREIVWEPTKFLIADEPQKIKEAMPVFQGLFERDLNIFLSEPYFMEITPVGIEKAYGLSKLMDYLSVQREELMAVGDGYNDLPMLRFAGTSVAMGNAYEEVKKEADFVTADNEHDGVAEAIERFVLSGATEEQ